MSLIEFLLSPSGAANSLMGMVALIQLYVISQQRDTSIDFDTLIVGINKLLNDSDIDSETKAKLEKMLKDLKCSGGG